MVVLLQRSTAVAVAKMKKRNMQKNLCAVILVKRRKEELGKKALYCGCLFIPENKYGRRFGQQRSAIMAGPTPSRSHRPSADRLLPAASAASRLSRAIYTISDLIFVDLLRVRRRRLARSSNSRINARQRTRALHRRDDAQPTHFFRTDRRSECYFFSLPLFPYRSLFVFSPAVVTNVPS